MSRRVLNLSKSDSGLEISEFAVLVGDWLLDNQLNQRSPATLFIRKNCLDKFLWFLERKEFTHVGPTELKSFLLYLTNGHTEEGGRFGNPKLVTPLKAISINGYFRVLRGFFNWLDDEELIVANPMKRIKAPSSTTENKQPISPEHVEALLKAARNSENPYRDEALLMCPQ